MLEWLEENAVRLMEWLAAAATAFCAWLAGAVLVLGYPGIMFLMAVESSLFPFPSELVMPPAGYLIHEGRMSWVPVILSGIAGSMLGALFNYHLALRFGRPFLIRYGKYFFLKPEDLDRAEKFFAAHGEITTFAGRLIPVIRQIISLPAGAARMPQGKFCLYTGLGASLWVIALTAVGWLVGKNQDLLHEYMRNLSLWALGGAVATVLIYIKAHKWKTARSAVAPDRKAMEVEDSSES